MKRIESNIFRIISALLCSGFIPFIIGCGNTGFVDGNQLSPTSASPIESEKAIETPLGSTDTFELTESPSVIPTIRGAFHVHSDKEADFGKGAVEALDSAFRSPADEIKPLENIPIYFEDDLVSNDFLYMFGLGLDSGKVLNNTMFNSGELCLSYFREAAFRKLKDGRLFMIFDLDSGNRVFIQLGRYNWVKGHALIVSFVNEYSSFSSLKPGASIDKVIEIDRNAIVYKHIADSYAPGRLEDFKNNEEVFTSLHYLSDGILKIEYAVNEDNELVVSSIEYSKNYQLPDCNGEMVDYRLCEVDTLRHTMPPIP